MSEGIENLSVLHNTCWENPKGNGGDSSSGISVDTFVKWGNIVGTLSDQQDLKTALDNIQAKVDLNADELASHSDKISDNAIDIDTINKKIETIESNIGDLEPLIYAGL